MAGEWDSSTLTTAWKNIYGEFVNRVPDKFPLLAGTSFKPAKRTGLAYIEAVLLTFDGHFDYRESGESVFSYGTPVPAKILDATIVGTNLHGYSRVSYEAAARGAQGGAAAFRGSVGIATESLNTSGRDRLESDCWNGQLDIGVIDAGGVVSGPPIKLTISFDSWAVGNYACKENTVIDIFDTTLGTYRGQTAISSVDLENRVLTVTSLPGGTVATDRIFYATQVANGSDGSIGTLRSMQGIHSAIGITASGSSIYGIDAKYTGWVAAQKAVGDILNLSAIMSGVASYYNKGNDDDLDVFVAAGPWVTAASEWTALKRFGNSDKNFVLGANELEIVGLGIKTQIRCSRYCRSGRGVGVSLKKLERIGAQELAPQVIGQKGDIFVYVPGSNAFEFQVYSNQALYFHPSDCINYTGITG
jgi:hypothetical protein